MLEDLIISRVRVKILALFFLNPDKMYHLREIQRQTNEAMNAIRREMEYLQSKGFASSERRENRKYFQMRRDNPLYFDLLGLINKTEGLGRAIIENRAKLGKIKFIMFSGRYIEINYTVMSEEEFAFRKKRRDPFVTAVLAGSRLLVIGDEEELVR